jgi:tRNA U55 pseudouridine synthase TruB
MSAIAEAALAGRLSEMLLPLDAGIETIPRVDLNEEATLLLRDGAAISAKLCGAVLESIQTGEQVRLMVADQLAALGRRTDAGVQPERVFITPNATPPGRRHPVEAG